MQKIPASLCFFPHIFAESKFHQKEKNILRKKIYYATPPKNSSFIDEPADETSKSVFFERNQSAIIKCSIGDSGFEPGTLHFSKGHENITKERTTVNR
jgi:hypothetical protein